MDSPSIVPVESSPQNPPPKKPPLHHKTFMTLISVVTAVKPFA